MHLTDVVLTAAAGRMPIIAGVSSSSASTTIGICIDHRQARSESPAKAGDSIADIAAGMYAYSGILAR